MNGMGLALWLVSVALLGGTSLLVALAAARAWGERFWIAVGATSGQLGTVAVLTSAAGAFEPWPFLAVQAVVLAAAFLGYRRACRTAVARAADAISQRSPLPLAAKAMLLCTAAIVAASLFEQVITPITGFDERMYNCSRAAYWLQHRSIFPFPTHNEGHTDMPFGAEIYFGWAILFTRDDLWGKVAIWLGFPVATVGMYLLARAAGAARTAASAAALIFAATPTVLHIASTGQKQDVWTAAFALGTAFWVVRAARTAGLRECFWAGFFLLLAINGKTTALTLLPLVGGVALLARGRTRVPGRLTAAAAGMAAGLLLSGFLVVAVHNYEQHGSPLGSPGLKKVAQPDMSARQIWTHTVRVPLFLFELPAQPMESVRQATLDAGNWVLRTAGAAEKLPGEIENGWPGSFFVHAPPYAVKYSSGGMLWGVMLLAAAAVAVRRLIKRWPRLSPSPVIWVMMMSGAYLVGLVYLLRWVNGTWERYWLPAYALGLAGAVTMAGMWAGRRTWRSAAALVLIALTVGPSIRTQAARLERVIKSPPGPDRTQEPYEEVVPLLEPGSRILLVVNRHTREYALFLPDRGFPNSLFPWGREPFDPDRMARMLEDLRITHVLFERDDGVGFHWYTSIKTAGMVEWMRQREGFAEVPLTTPKMRLFQRSGLNTLRPTELPAFVGFKAVEGLAPPEGPYPSAGLPRVRWGQGPATRLAFDSAGEPVLLRLEGRRNNDPNQAMTVRFNGEEVARYAFGSPPEFKSFELLLRPRAGPNEVILEYAGTEGARRLAVLFRSIQVRPAAAPSP